MKRFYLVIVILLLTVSSFAQGHFKVAYSDNGQDHMNIFVITATINGVALETGDEIAAFDDKICCSKTILKQAIVISNKNSFAEIAPSRKDEGELNGYTIGNTIKFKIWDSRKSMEFSEIKAEFINQENGQTITPIAFSPGATAFVKLSVVVSDNKTPIPKAGEDQFINEGEDVILDGSGSSDPDGDSITYLWTSPDGITLSSVTDAKPTFIAPEVKADTKYTFFLVVNDGIESSTADEVTINIKQINKLPVAVAGPDKSVSQGVVVTLDGTASSDPDGDSITYFWTAPDGIMLSSTTMSKPTFIAPGGNINKPYIFSLIVNDGIVNSVASQVAITVNPVNKAPVANAGLDQTHYENILCTLDGTGSIDPDGNTLNYLWTPPAGIILSSISTAKPTFTIPEINQDTLFIFSLIVSDGITNSESSTVKIFVKNVIKTASEDSRNDRMIIYPNPSKGIYHINGLEVFQQNKIEIYSIKGNLISQKISNSIEEVIDISNQFAGMYLLLINNKPTIIQKY
jgi:hypothetical protein